MDQLPLQIIFEDQFFLAINKPAGLLSIRDGYDPSLPFARQVLEPEFGRLWTVHRLDRDTSGILLVARSPESHRALNSIFENHQAQKIYHAIVPGIPPWTEQLVDLPLKVNGDRRHRTVVNLSLGKPAMTRFRCLRSSGGYTLVEAQPFSGYTHQIRAHLYALGFPILADLLYFILPALVSTPGSTSPLINRLALHALSISFPHPFTSTLLNLQAPYPVDFIGVLQHLSLN